MPLPKDGAWEATSIPRKSQQLGFLHAVALRRSSVVGQTLILLATRYKKTSRPHPYPQYARQEYQGFSASVAGDM